jgi:RNA polymerase sigma-70 factor (ECF subfamily)
MELTMNVGDDPVEVRTGFDPFFHEHFERVARAAALVARDPAAGQDLAQEAFARALERWGALTSDDHARNFVYKVAINLARSHVRKHGRVFLYGLRDRDVAGSAGGIDAADAWLEVSEALGELSPRQRACVILVDYADLDSTRAADVLGMSAATVRVHLTRGRRTLQDRLRTARKEDPA